MELDNSAYEQRLLSAADLLWYEMNMKKTILKGISHEEFSPATYMRFKAHAALADTESSTAKIGKTPQASQSERSERK